MQSLISSLACPRNISLHVGKSGSSVQKQPVQQQKGQTYANTNTDVNANGVILIKPYMPPITACRDYTCNLGFIMARNSQCKESIRVSQVCLKCTFCLFCYVFFGHIIILNLCNKIHFFLVLEMICVIF